MSVVKTIFSRMATLVCIVSLITAYGLALMLILQSSNRYQWLRDEGFNHLPVDSDSPDRVMWLSSLVLSSAMITIIFSHIATNQQRLSSWLVWLACLPLLYACLRFLSLIFLVD